MGMIVLALALFPAQVPDSPIKRDEVVTFFPTYGRLDPSGAFWTLSVHGWIFEPEAESPIRNAAIELLRKSLDLSEDDVATAIFRERARRFLVDNERGKRIPIQIGETIHLMEPSRPDGHFEGTVRLAASEADRRAPARNDGSRWIELRAITRANDDRTFSGRIQLIGPTGLSVISDIDDTVKISEVGNRRALLENTFLKPFQAVPRMASLDARLAARGAAFHYVSNSPWQLFDDLHAFLRAEGFPEGTFHLRPFRWRVSKFLDLFASPETSKRRAIEPILNAFPRRRFVLMGDSGEKDPEIYGALAREYPARIARILIRNVNGERPDSTRLQKAFEGLPAGSWHLFNDPAEVILDGLGD